ncbi:efflux RND transporter periplasmic adaptor subunit [Tritonibacter litoralis]|uniref:efflux RND transporter periplasmic adaptor subunit n=1 Tax=Tritonibacter litoralis TaxID=2662264 RepID=UPI0031B622DF
MAGGIYAERFYLNSTEMAANSGPEILYWVAPMDANFRKEGPGKSPMGMDLIPVYAGEEPSSDPSEVMLSAAEINAIGVRTAVAQVDDISQSIETVGFVGYNEHLTSHIHTRVEGWIEEIEVRAVGDIVAKGDVMFEMFSPLIGAASAEHIRSLEEGNQLITEISRNKLRSHGVSDQQIQEIEKTRKTARNLKFYAPQDGVVIALSAVDGMFLQPNIQAVSLADPSNVWLIVDVFERDIARITDDMTASIEFEHLNGQVFEGQIDYIYPELDAETRTLPVRLSVDNTAGILKPNMFGTVSLTPNETRKALTVPTEAIIRTGRSERVILKTGEGTFAPRLVTTGLRDDFDEGGRTEVVQGLAPGDEVVASAQFLIDSESALSAGLMRMAPTDAEPAQGVGELLAFEPTTRMATIRHTALESLGWPEMDSQFPVKADVRVESLMAGQQVAFQIVRGADGLLSLVDIGSDDGVAATGNGVIEAVTDDGLLSMSHDPIPELGWPAMQMDMPVTGFDPATVPIGSQVSFDLAKDGEGMFVIVAVRTDDTAMPEPMTETEEKSMAAAQIVVGGAINAIDATARTVTINHGPIAEIGMPGMTMDFGVTDLLDLETLQIGAASTLSFDRPDGMTMVLAAAETIAPAMKVMGTINDINLETGMANITHGPMVDIGMPGMTMNFTIDPSVDVQELPTDVEVALLMTRNPDFSLTLVGVEARDEQVTQ